MDSGPLPQCKQVHQVLQVQKDVQTKRFDCYSCLPLVIAAVGQYTQEEELIHKGELQASERTSIKELGRRFGVPFSTLRFSTRFKRSDSIDTPANLNSTLLFASAGKGSQERSEH